MSDTDLTGILTALDEILQARKSQQAQNSYVASLYEAGLEAITGKITEESAEVVEAAGGSDDHLVHEVADLWFHCMVLLAYRDLSTDDILSELARRFGVSGLEEKASRSE